MCNESTKLNFELPIHKVLRQQIKNLQSLQTELKTIQLGEISMAQCVQHSKRLAAIKAKIDAYYEVIDLLDIEPQPAAAEA